MSLARKKNNHFILPGEIFWSLLYQLWPLEGSTAFGIINNSNRDFNTTLTCTRFNNNTIYFGYMANMTDISLFRHQILDYLWFLAKHTCISKKEEMTWIGLSVHSAFLYPGQGCDGSQEHWVEGENTPWMKCEYLHEQISADVAVGESYVKLLSDLCHFSVIDITSLIWTIFLSKCLIVNQD